MPTRQVAAAAAAGPEFQAVWVGDCSKGLWVQPGQSRLCQVISIHMHLQVGAVGQNKVH